MIVFELIFKHQTVVSVTGTSSKMASTLCQKAQNSVLFRSYDFVQISLACGPNTYQIMYGETLTSNVSIGTCNIKCPI